MKTKNNSSYKKGFDAGYSESRFDEEMKEAGKLPRFIILLLGFFLGFLAMILTATALGDLQEGGSVLISNETATDICKQLTNSTDVHAYDKDWKLICEVPSYDHTMNIIIRPSGQINN